MDIKSLAASVKSQLRSGFNLHSFKQCVIELVLNSIDAKSSAVSIRINFASFRIQVVDNGCGISQTNLNLVGTRYATSKCRSLKDLEKRPKFYGLRGESLASIASCSKKIVITSRVNDNDTTYSKTFENGKWRPVETVRFRPSKGTTVTIENFLYNMPVRREQIKPNLDVEEIRMTIESLSFVHPSISFSIRDDVNNKIISQTQRVETVAEALTNAYPDIKIEYLEQLQVTKNKISVTGLIYKYPYSINKLQLIYVNKRPVECQMIQKVVNKLFSKSSFHQRSIQVLENHANYVVYLLNISCTTSEVDISLEYTKTLAEFKNQDVVLKCVEKLITKFLEDEELLAKSEKVKNNSKIRNEPLGKADSGVNISNIGGVFKSIPAKRKKNEVEKNKKDSELKKLKPSEDLETNKINDNIEIAHNNHSRDSKIALTTKENKRTIFDRHNNTQSLVLNSETEEEQKVAVNNIEAALNETQTKGKNIILDMFLKSSVLYKSDSPKSIFNCFPNENFKRPLEQIQKSKDSNTTITFSIKVNTHRTVVKSSIYTIRSANGVSGGKKNKFRDVGVETSVRNFGDQNYSKNKSTKCVQTTLEQHEEKEFRLRLNFDRTNQNNRNVPEITLYDVLNTKVEKSQTNNPSDIPFQTTEFHSDSKKSHIETKNKFRNNKNNCNKYRGCISKINLCDMKLKKNKGQCCYIEEISTTLSNTKYIEETYNLKNMDNILKNKYNDVFQCGLGRHLNHNNRKRWPISEDNDQKQYYELIPKIQRDMKCNRYKKIVHGIEEINRTSCCHKNNNILMNNKYKNVFKQNHHVPFVASDNFGEQSSSKSSFNSHRNYLKKSDSFPSYSKYNTNCHKKYMNTIDKNATSYHKFAQYEGKNINLDKKILNKCKCKKCSQRQQKNEPQWLNFNKGKENYEINTRRGGKNTFKIPLDIQYKSKNKKDCLEKQSFQLVENFNFAKSQQEDFFYDKNVAGKSTDITNFTILYNSAENQDERTINETDLNNLESIKSVQFNEKNPAYMNILEDFCQKENPKKQKLLFHIEQETNKTQSQQKPFTLSLKKSNSCPTAHTSPFEKNIFNVHSSSQNYPVENNVQFKLIKNCDDEQLNTTGNTNSKENNFVDKGFINYEDKGCSKSPKIICDVKELDENSEDKLVITFSETEMNDLIKKDLVEEANNYAHSDSCSAEENDKKIENKKFFDLKTGMTLCPTLRTSDFFNFTKRIPIIPKGLSPIMKFKTQVDGELSQNSKNALLMKIMQSYEEELKEVKWEKIKNEADVNNILNQFYADKCKNYETIYPILLPLSVNQASAIKFTNEIFNDIDVVGSVDKKFIVVYAKLQQLLIVIDQHAAHERVRLEKLIDEYKHQETKGVTFKESKLNEVIPLKLSSDELQYLSSNDVKNHFKNLGVLYNIQGNCMDIATVPTCLFNKVIGNVETEKDTLLILFVSSFIKEELDFLKGSRCFSKTIPNFLNKIINMEACRGAIKFGDVLTMEERQDLIQSLSFCKLPFQCAHGRPTLIPLANMKKISPKKQRDVVNLKKLKVC